MNEERYDRLRSTAVFGGLSKAALETLLEDAQHVEHSAGEYYFLAGEPGESLFLIESGEVAVTREFEGTEYVLAQLKAGDCFGELALIEFGPRSAAVKATCDCRAIEIGSGSIHQLYAADLEQFTLLQMNLGREVSRRLRKADDRLFAVRVAEESKRGER